MKSYELANQPITNHLTNSLGGLKMYADTSKLIVWQKSHELTLKIYEITKNFPKDEQFG